METKKKIILSVISAVYLSGCSSAERNIDYNMHVPRQSVYNKMIKVKQYEDKYEIILGNFGASLSKYARFKYPTYKNINIEIAEMKNKTSDGEIPISSQGVLINSLGRLTATSRNFFPLKKIMVDKGTLVIQDDLNKYAKVARVIQIEGSINRSDVIYSKNNSFTGDATMTSRGHRADLGFETQDNDSIREISLSLHFVDKRDGRGFNDYARYGQAENSIKLAKKSDGSGYGVFLLGSGITNSGFRTFTPGVHQAIKILVQHTLIQTFGRYFEVPYWNCSDMYTVDKMQKNNMKLDWESSSLEKKRKAIKLVLNMYGFSIPIQNKDAKEKELAIQKTELALKAIEKRLGITGTINDFNYYFNLYNNMPFAGFFPKNYNSLISDIKTINNGGLPNYRETKRSLPLIPQQRNTENSTVIIRSDGGMDIIQYPKREERNNPIPIIQHKSSNSSVYDLDKQHIDEAEANLFK